MAVISEYPLHNTGQEVQTAIDDALTKLPYQIGLKANEADVLTKTNTDAYTPTADYHPATKLYVDTVRPTVQIGQTITGEEGTQAKVENKGTPRDAILDFTIPKGDTGDAAGFDTPTAEAETLEPGSQATASVVASGEATNKKFDFHFGIPQGIQGIQGLQGFYTNKLERTGGTGASGTRDTYTLYLNDEESTPIGSFDVYNGADGEGAGTVTEVGLKNIDDNSLTITDTPVTSNGTILIKHTNSVTPTEEQGFYPVTIDSSGHISSYGEKTRMGDMYRSVYDINENDIVDGAESLHDETSQIWFELS